MSTRKQRRKFETARAELKTKVAKATKKKAIKKKAESKKKDTEE